MPPRICLLIFTLSTIFGIVCGRPKHSVRSGRSLPVNIVRMNDVSATYDSRTDSEDDVLEWIKDIQALSDSGGNTNNDAPRTTQDPDNVEHEMARMDAVLDETVLNDFYNFINVIHTVYRPLLREKLDEVPSALVCMLLGRENCVFEAELITISTPMEKAFRSLIYKVKEYSCHNPSNSRSFTNNFLNLLTVDDSTIANLAAVQRLFLSSLDQLPEYFSKYVLSAWRIIVDLMSPSFAKYISDMIVKILQIPTDYLKFGLRFLIEIPVLNKSEQCQQGDLKQLILWGMNHNVSWSLGNSVLDFFLTPEPPPCSYPSLECTSTNSAQDTRSLGQVLDSLAPLLGCDSYSLVSFNNTLCFELLSFDPQDFAILRSFCKALSALTAAEMEQVRRNGCHSVRSLLSPFLNESCGEGSSSSPELPVVRATLSLSELLCNYTNWTSVGHVDPALVTLCSDNDRQKFLLKVCPNANMMHLLVEDSSNAWLWNFCANNSGGNIVSLYCAYETWQMDPSLVSFCWDKDKERLERFLCEDLEFFMQLFSDPRNAWLSTNCTYLEPPTQPDISVLISASCRYSDWHNPSQVTAVILSMCIQNDEHGFLKTVCSNSTFLKELMRNEMNLWVRDYCTISPGPTATEPPTAFSIKDWCSYKDWGVLMVDPSVVGLCWQFDQVGFQYSVCCNVSLLEKLTMDPQNEWLVTMCGDKEMLAVLPQVCRYGDWSYPTIVDMTDLALCAELDPMNFTRQVCANATVLQNLLANLDNTWLLKHCANHSGTGAENLTGFNPLEQCQYKSWGVSFPDAFLLALCWDYDQANFVPAVCTDITLLSLFAQEPSSVWVGTLCSAFVNSTSTNTSTNTNSSIPGSRPCLARDLMKWLNWSCTTDFSAACQPGASLILSVQLILRCGAEVLQPQMGMLLTKEVSSVVSQATSELVVALLILEERQNTSLHVTENIRLSVLESVASYLKWETNFNNKRILLQCFGNVLTSLMQTGRAGTSADYFLLTEYFRIPLVNLRAVLRAVDVTTVRQILLYFSRNQGTLQLSEEYLRTMISVFFQTTVAWDASLFSDLQPLLVHARAADILSLPPVAGNADVLKEISTRINSFSPEQRRAFGKWFSQSVGFLNMTARGPFFINDTGDLIVYLPFPSFQHLSPAQMENGLDVLLRNALTPMQGQFVAQTLLVTYRNLTTEHFKRLGNLTCLANPGDLLAYRNTEAFAVIQGVVMECVSQGFKVPSDMISSLVLNDTELDSPSSLSPGRVSELARLLPTLGVSYLRRLAVSQLRPALPALASTPFTPAQAHEILSKILPNYNLELPGQLLGLGSLVSGVKVETIRALPSATLLSALPGIALLSPGLSISQANAITTKLWGSPEVSGWLDQVEPLLSQTPLLSVLTRTSTLLANQTSARSHAWNIQQAKSLFRKLMNMKTKLSMDEFLALGTLAQGVNCKILRQLFLAQPSTNSLRSLLAFLREQPVPLHSSLKTCIVNELYQFNVFSELLGDLGLQTALEISISIIKTFPANTMDTLRKMIVEDPRPFLKLPSIKQALLVHKMTQRLRIHTGQYTEEEFRSLGVMATFVADEMFLELDRSFFVESLEFLRGFCYTSSKRDMVAMFLQEPIVFGSVMSWEPETLDMVDRFIFFLPKDILRQIPRGLMTYERLERLFLSQQQWEAGEMGASCTQGMEPSELQKLFEKQQFLLQLFLGVLRVGQLTRATLFPSCENLQITQPSAWNVDSLIGMSADAFTSCLELIGQDPFRTSYELMLLLNKVKKIFGPASTFSPSVISQLGRISTLLSEEELSWLNLSDLNTISALGAVNGWSTRQLSVLFSSVLNSTKMSPSQLDSSTFVALGHIVCGIKVSDMKSLNAVEFSKAVLRLGRMRLLCSEEQLQVLVGLLSNSLAFGPISSWGSEVFIEIGALAAGIPDMCMSALVMEQIEGITPLAVSLIPSKKFAVVFDQAHFRMFSYEQAVAVTESQRAALTTVQLTALSMVLTPWEDRPIDFRGRSSGLLLCPCPFFLLLELLMLRLLLICPSL